MHGPYDLPIVLLPEHDAYLPQSFRMSTVSVHGLAPPIFRAYRLEE